MIKVAELSRQGFINGDISTVMSRARHHLGPNALIFGDIGFAFRSRFNKSDESERRYRRILPAVFDQDLHEAWSERELGSADRGARRPRRA